jgi:hypothetical protein
MPKVSTCMRTKVEHWPALVKPGASCPSRTILCAPDDMPHGEERELGLGV